MIQGNIDSIRKSVLEQMESMYELRTEYGDFINSELAETLAVFTDTVGREIAVYIDRGGRVKQIAIGERDRADLPKTDSRSAEGRLNGLKCIHTHPNGSGALSDIDIQSLRTLKFDAMAAIGVKEGKPVSVQAAFLGEIQQDGSYSVLVSDVFKFRGLPQQTLFEECLEAQRRVQPLSSTAVETSEKERAILIGLDSSQTSMDELARLAETAGAEVLESVIQNRAKKDSATLFGSGKVDELKMLRQRMNANLFIVNDELSGAQQRNLEERLGTKVIDRSMLILDIFAQRAISYEGQLQVELAMLKYRLPRLIGMGTEMSRIGGGGGIGSHTKGSGEKKLEVDKRYIRARIEELQSKIDEVAKQRNTRRQKRQRDRMPIVALVGYTNAGKSTLLNLLSGADVLAEDKLFATLDPVSRKVILPDGAEILLIDTVGFIDKLPHEFVDSFRSTLEEAKYADILLHVVDGAAVDAKQQINVVNNVIASLGAEDKPMIMVYNKSDKITELPAEDGGIVISAANRIGIDRLLEKISETVHMLKNEVKLIVPYSAGKALDYLHRGGCVIEESYDAEGTVVAAKLSDEEKGIVLSMGAFVLD